MSAPGIILQADARRIPLADESVQCVVTSPPYWGLRRYGPPDGPVPAGCLGLERTPEEYVANLVAVFAEVRRVLWPRGTAWIVLGDSHYQGPKGSSGELRASMKQSRNRGSHSTRRGANLGPNRQRQTNGLKPKDLCGIPWTVALALRAAGWYLRQDIIWHKPNGMCESAPDRPTGTHDYVFLLSKSARYWFDRDAVREPYAESTGPRNYRARRQYAPPGQQPHRGWAMQSRRHAHVSGWVRGPGEHTSLANFLANPHLSIKFERQTNTPAHPDGRNIRSVWTIPIQPFAGGHFATYPEELARRCILAGCPPGGIVLDPFAGSGTTGVAAEKAGRRYVLLDLWYQELARVRTLYDEEP